MTLRGARLLVAAATMGVVVSSSSDAQGQTRRSLAESVERACPMVYDFAAFHRCALQRHGSFEPPRTAVGMPDFRGRWSPTRIALDIEEIPPDKYLAASGSFFPAINSLVVDPADGKIPYQPWAQDRRAELTGDFISNSAMCFPIGAPRTFYSGNSRIIQTEDDLIILTNRRHTFRIIPLDGSPHVRAGVTLWMGDSRGQWEGDTLVVETTNMNDLIWFDHQGTFMTDKARMVERFTYVDANTIHYEATFEDPAVFTQPWTISVALLRRPPVGGLEGVIVEDNMVENCDIDMPNYYRLGMRPYPGISTLSNR